MQDVALILDVLDDRNQDAGIALPQENAFDLGDRIPRQKILDLAIVIGQHHHGNIQPGLLHLACQLRGVHVADRKVGHDQVELLSAGQRCRFGTRRNVRDSRDLLQA